MKPLLALALLPLLASLQAVQSQPGQAPIVVISGPGLEPATLTVDCQGIEVTIIIKGSEGPLTATIKNGDIDILACALSRLAGHAPGIASYTTTIPAHTGTTTINEAANTAPIGSQTGQAGYSPPTTTEGLSGNPVDESIRLAIAVAAGLLGGLAALAWSRR